ncbi:hypothetical protein PI126_g8607, partial [Phytophthora idaei]
MPSNPKKKMCKVYKVIVLGDSGVGKSSLLWDTAGQEKFGAARLPSSFFRHADAALVVYDVTNRQSFIGVLRWVLQLQTYRSAAAADSDFSIVLVGHKCDVSNATRQAHENEGRDFAKIIAAFHFFERSSKDGTGRDRPHSGEAKKYKSESKVRVEAKNALDNYAYNLRNSLNGEKLKEKTPEADKKAVDDKVPETLQWLDANQAAEKEDSSRAHPVLQKVYASAGDESDSVHDLKKAIKAEKPNKILCDANELQLYLAKKVKGAVAEEEKGDDQKEWLTQLDALEGVSDTSGYKNLQFTDAELRDVGLDSGDLGEVSRAERAAGMGHVHVLVKLPEHVADAASAVPLPRTTALNEPETYAEECLSLTEWDVGVVHKIPLIWEFMSSLGGCTTSGEIFWRMEDKQVVSLMVDGWFRESTRDRINVHANKKSILMGSPGIGKSTLLCVMAFHLVFKHKKNVLVYRRLTGRKQSNCLFYLGYEDGKVVQFAVQRCKAPNAISIYEHLIRQQGISN